MRAIKSIVDFRHNDHLKNCISIFTLSDITFGIANKQKFKTTTTGVC